MSALIAVAGTPVIAVLRSSYRLTRNTMKEKTDTTEKEVKSMIESEKE